MKRYFPILIALIFSIISPLPASVQGIYDAVSQNGTLSFIFRPGETELSEESLDGKVYRHYDFFNANGAVFSGDSSYGVVRLPLFYDENLPTVSVTVTREDDGASHGYAGDLYELSAPAVYRGRSLIYLTLHPYYRNNRFAGEIAVSVSGTSVSPLDRRAFSQLRDMESARGLKYLDKTVQTQSFDTDGIWLELQTDTTGIFAITRQDLINAGVTGSFSDSQISLFDGARYGRILRGSLDVEAGFHLREIPLLFLQGAETAEDKWVFYAAGMNEWQNGEDILEADDSQYSLNPYENRHHLKLFVGDRSETALRMTSYDNQLSGSETVQEYAYRRYHLEEELINPGNGGELWLGQRLSAQNTLSVRLLDPVENAPAYGSFSFGYASTGTHTVSVYNGDSLLTSIYKNLYNNPDYYSNQSDLIQTRQVEIPFSAADDTYELSVQYQGQYNTGEVFYNYIQLIYPAAPAYQAADPSLWFLPESYDRKLTLTGLSGLTYLFDVSDPSGVRYTSLSGSSHDIKLESSNVTTAFQLYPESAFRSVLSIEKESDFIPVNSEDMSQQYDMIIVTPEAFLSQAQQLAQHKENREREALTVLVKSYEEIVDQYNAGNRDPYAIRYFLHDIYMNGSDPKPAYVLLLGDGHFDYQNKLFSKPVYIPHLYEAGKQWNCDDIFVNLDSDDDRLNDMAIGRIPAEDVNEAAAVVEKIIDYESHENNGDWQLKAMLVADDPTDEAQGRYNERSFINDSEKLWQQTIPSAMRSSKVYLTEYPERYITELQTMGRDGAREDILENFNTGVSLVNYYGHGDPSVWTQENVFTANDLLKLDMEHHYPIISAATCSWGRSDTPELQSMAEKMVTSEANGAIATVATVRAVTHAPNKYFVQSFYGGLFPDYPHTRPTLLGDAYLYAKNLSNNSAYYRENNKKFMLFGDPSLLPVFPENLGEFTSVSRDTLRALDNVDIQGRVFKADSSDLSQEGFSGQLTLYDNRYQVSREYVQTSKGALTTISYYLEGNKLFSGDIDIAEDEFTARAFIPKDIQYTGENAKLRLQYEHAEGGTAGSIVLETLHVGGVNPDAAEDVTGPQIVFRSGDELMNGSVLRDTSVFRIEFSDESGINITGQTGHGLELTLDEGSDVLDLSDYFSYADNDYALGIVELPVSLFLDEGEHHLSVSAFDNYNNYAQKDIELTVLSSSQGLLTQVVNYPNPFSERTEFTFSAAESGTADISVYTLSGRPVGGLRDVIVKSGFNRFEWIAEDAYGMRPAAGVYLYVIRLTADGGETETARNKLLLLP